MSKKFKRVIIPIGIVLILFLGNVFSADGSKQQTEIEQQEDTSYNKKAFDPSKMIFHHIADAHDWHVMDIGRFPFFYSFTYYSLARREIACFYV